MSALAQIRGMVEAAVAELTEPFRRKNTEQDARLKAVETRLAALEKAAGPTAPAPAAKAPAASARAGTAQAKGTAGKAGTA